MGSPATTMTNRGAIAAAFVAGAMLVAVAVVAYGGAAPTAKMSLAQKKAALAALSQQTMQELKVIRFGADRFGDTGKESGNRGAEWNVGSFPTASSPGFKHNYWDYGAKAGTYGKFAIDEHIDKEEDDEGEEDSDDDEEDEGGKKKCNKKKTKRAREEPMSSDCAAE